ncbi:MAG: response regulator [Deltaproteobacteria bacterium]|jgi:signal transduction histidine kinase/DNA-binding response OmpR family regulator|nr:response regulator [Deltaproteobacteria bacterium]
MSEEKNIPNPLENKQKLNSDIILFNYLRDVIYCPNKAYLDIDLLDGDAKNLGLGIKFLADCIGETRAFSEALARGDLGAQMPSAGNEIAAPLKTLYSSLKHLTWQSQQIAAGDYSQQVDFMGAFADAFNTMIRQLDRRNRELLISKETAEAASRAKSTFLATVSHEMRTPLNAILGLSAVELQRELPILTRMNLEKIWNAGSSLLRIVNDILDISRAESGTFEIISVDYDIINLINDIVQINIVRIGSKPINFVLSIDENIPRRLKGDSLRVKQVLNNILSNAFKYTERGKVHFNITCERENNKANIIFKISDTGIGIKREEMSRLFTENSKINSEANRYVEGTGLGLAITYYLVNLMKGIITAESEYGSGSSFTVNIPQSVIDGEPIGYDAAQDLMTFKTMARGLSVEGNLVRTRMPYGHVLLVDDVPTNLDVAEGLLSPYGLKVSTATSAREAIEMVRTVAGNPRLQKFDIILMDHMMPGMDGIEATRIIRELDSDYARTVPIVAFTANAIRGAEGLFLQNGFNAFIAKPLDIMQLDTVLNRYVKKDNAEVELIEPVNLSVGETLPNFGENSFLSGVKIDGLDIQTGIKRYGSDEKYLKILTSYVHHIPKLLDTLKATARSSILEYGIAVHGLKGSSYGIAAKVVGDISAKLERMAKDNNLNNFAETHLLLIEKTQKLIDDINSVLNTIKKLNASQEPKEKLLRPNTDILEKIMEYAKRGKTSLMDDNLKELEKFSYEEDQALIEQLREDFENFEYQSISERIQKKLLSR